MQNSLPKTNATSQSAHADTMLFQSLRLPYLNDALTTKTLQPDCNRSRNHNDRKRHMLETHCASRRMPLLKEAFLERGILNSSTLAVVIPMLLAILLPTIFHVSPSLRLFVAYRSLRASRSDSSRQRMSSSRTVAQSVSKPNTPILRFCRTGSLDVSDDGTGGVVHEFNADLGHTSTRACCAEIISLVSSPLPFHFQRASVFVPVRPRTRVTLTSLTGTL